VILLCRFCMHLAVTRCPVTVFPNVHRSVDTGGALLGRAVSGLGAGAASAAALQSFAERPFVPRDSMEENFSGVRNVEKKETEKEEEKNAGG